MTEAARHPVLLRGPRPGVARAAPVILQRTDDDFVDAVLGELAAPRGLDAVLQSEAAARDTAAQLTVFQPVQRTFHLVLVEALCDVVGSPRLDPDKIESAGLVVRRVAARTSEADSLDGWRQAGGALRGWVPFASRAEQDLDPDPERRPAPLRAGHPEIDRRLLAYAASVERLTEDATPLFVAPPEVCGAAGRTLLYGVLPVTSPDLAAAPDGLTFSQDDVKEFVSPYLFSGTALVVSPRSAMVDRDSPATLAGDGTFQKILTALQQATVQFGAFGDAPDGRAFFALLNQHSLTMQGGGTRPLGDWMREASDLLVLRLDRPPLRMPEAWPAFQPTLRQALLAHMQQAMQARVAEVRPNVGRFEDSARLYRARGFVRLREEGPCRRAPVWTEYTEPFRIAPWYEGSGRPPVRIDLPELDADLLKKLKPNVAVSLPPKLLNMLNNTKLKAVLDGSRPSEQGTTIQWICSFNLLIVFMVAFMVMFVFLVVFDLFFRWLAFVKICIPIPRRESP